MYPGLIVAFKLDQRSLPLPHRSFDEFLKISYFKMYFRLRLHGSLVAILRESPLFKLT